MRHATIDPYSQKEHTEIHQIPKFGVNRAPVVRRLDNPIQRINRCSVDKNSTLLVVRKIDGENNIRDDVFKYRFKAVPAYFPSSGPKNYAPYDMSAKGSYF